MSKLNPKNKGAALSGAVSYNGNPQYKKATKQELYELVVSTMYGNDTFYETTDVRLDRLISSTEKLVKDGELDFIANTIVHARTVMNMRSMPLILTAVFLKMCYTNKTPYSNTRELVCDVIQRADQVTDMFAMGLNVFGSKNKMPNQFKLGIADAMNKFNAYQFGKYNSKGAVKMSDVLRVIHPKAKDGEQGQIFESIMKNTLETPYTWETELSANGQKVGAEKKSDAQLWGELVNSGKLGYMALLRNLRNISQAGLNSAAMQVVYDRLSDVEQVAKSKQFPFRFKSAYDNVATSDSKLKRAISRAADASLSNVPALGDKTWIIMDVSASMGGMWGNRSNSGLPVDTASMFAAALMKANAESNDVVLTLFSDRAKHVSVNTDAPVLDIAKELKSSLYGGGTDLQAALDLKSTLGFEPDTIVLLSDMEVNRLRSKSAATSIFKKDAVKVALNLNSNGSTPVHENQGWYQLSGWSERLFQFVPSIRNAESVTSKLSVPYLGMDVKNLD